MPESEKKKDKSRSSEEIAESWETHNLADYWERTKEVEADVRLNRGRKVNLDPDIYAKLEELAKSRGISVETLVHLWLAERLLSLK